MIHSHAATKLSLQRFLATIGSDRQFNCRPEELNLGELKQSQPILDCRDFEGETGLVISIVIPDLLCCKWKGNCCEAISDEILVNIVQNWKATKNL